MGDVIIDFNAAGAISDYIVEEISEVDTIATNSSNAITPLKELSSIYFSGTATEHDKMHKKITELSEKISGFSTSFDKSVNNYYLEESGASSDDQESQSIINIFNKISNEFVWGYKQGSSINKISDSELESLLIAKGAILGKNGLYEIEIDGEVYGYNIKTRKLFAGNGKTNIRCDFYLSSNYNNESINSVVTLLGGTGERYSGPMAKDKVTEDISLSKNGLLIVPFKGVDKITGTIDVVNSNKFGEEIFNVSKDATRSVVGFSEGTHVAAKTISENPDMFDNIVFVNGATRYNSDANTSIIKNCNYEGFQNANIYYIISKGGWATRSVTGSVDDLINNGVNPQNITFICNDRAITNTVNSSVNIVNVMPDPAPKFFNGHGPGGWDILNKSEIIGYLSTCSKGGI